MTNNENPTPELISKEEVRSYIKSAVNKLGPEFSKEEKKEHAQLLVKIFEQGLSPKEAMKISDEEMSQIYSFAFHKFSAGNYEDARELFKMLLSLEPFNSEFATALGVCHHRLKNYELALQCYMLNSVLAPQDPVGLFYAYDCFMNLNNEIAAAIMLSNVIARAGDQPMYTKIKTDAQSLLERLEKKIVYQEVDKKL